jgi:hypothetical protein
MPMLVTDEGRTHLRFAGTVSEDFLRGWTMRGLLAGVNRNRELFEPFYLALAHVVMEA